MDNTYYQWWSTSKEGLFNEENYDTLYESIEHIYNLCQQNEYDGILGSSQGSVLVQIIVYLQEHPNLFEEKYKKFKFKFKFAIIGCTFSITDIKYKNLYGHKINLPILNIYGLNDELVPYLLSKELNNKCNNLKYFEHKGKHYIPTTQEMKVVLLDFFKTNLNMNFE